MFKRILTILSVLALGQASQVQAGAWISAEAGRAEYFRNAAVSGGGTLGAAEAWVLQGSLSQSLALVPYQSGGIRGRELALGVGFYPNKFWDLSLDTDFGGDGDELRYGGASVIGGLHVGEGWFKSGLTVSGGSTHYHFAPEQSLRQRSGAANLRVELGPHVALGASGGGYSYDRDLAGSGGLGSVPGGGPFGLLQPVGQETTTIVAAHRGPQRDPLLAGFPSRDWGIGVDLDLDYGALLGVDYSQTEIIETGVWDKVAGAFWRQKLSVPLALKLAFSKAVEGGSGSPYFSLAMTWIFQPRVASGEKVF